MLIHSRRYSELRRKGQRSCDWGSNDIATVMLGNLGIMLLLRCGDLLIMLLLRYGDLGKMLLLRCYDLGKMLLFRPGDLGIMLLLRYGDLGKMLVVIPWIHTEREQRLSLSYKWLLFFPKQNLKYKAPSMQIKHIRIKSISKDSITTGQ